ncbi:MAG TPA: 50S ribosomal protein L18e [Nitrososphaerales archaeon]|nr:50S ribosomal protein L18e [Nitrososphaerales archaeon]
MTSSNPLLRRTVVLLERAGKEEKARVWSAASKLLNGPTSSKVEVNLGRISRIAKEGEAIFVPGKVLGSGIIDKKVTVGAFTFSASARNKIAATGGSALTVDQFVKKFPDGRGVKLVE